MPAAGLAAPQIGINKAVFIFSYDRSKEHLVTVINPKYKPLEGEKFSSWEGCFSVLESEKTWKLAKIPRFEKIQATYIALNGEQVDTILTGFAAKVFQHECDHLEGIVNINHPEAVVESFTSKEDMENFITEVKKEDAERYKQPDTKNE